MDEPRAAVTTVDPAVETAGDEGRAIADPALLLDNAAPAVAAVARPPLPFAARFQGILIVVLFVALAMILQQGNKTLYQLGFPLLVGAAFLQIVFGNIPPQSDARRSLLLLLLGLAIIVAVFAVSVALAPTLIATSRGGR